MKKLLLICMPAALFVGCGTVRDNVPATELNGVLNGQPFKFVGPKDMQADSIEFNSSSNGVSCKIVNLKASTNPELISMTGDAYTKMRAADMNLWMGIIQSGGAAVGQGAAAFGKTAVTK